MALAVAVPRDSKLKVDEVVQLPEVVAPVKVMTILSVGDVSAIEEPSGMVIAAPPVATQSRSMMLPTVAVIFSENVSVNVVPV